MSILHFTWKACRTCVHVLATLVLWTIWLALAILLAVQAYVASTSQLAVPGFVIRAIEDRLAASGIHATIGRTLFDPAGRVLIENAALTLPGFEEPVITARAIYVQLDPWALVVKRVEPVDIWGSGVSLRVPAMLSPTGKSEEIVRDLDATVRPAGDLLEIESASGWIGNLPVFVRGTVHVGSVSQAENAPLPAADLVARNYGALTRKAAAIVLQLQALDRPSLRVMLSPSETRGAIARIALSSEGLKLADGVEAGPMRVLARVALGNGAPAQADLDVACERVRGPGSFESGKLKLRIDGKWDARALHFQPTWVVGAAGSVKGYGFTAFSPIFSLVPAPWPRFTYEVRAMVPDEPLAIAGTVDFAAKTLDARIQGALSPSLLAPLGRRMGKDLRRYVSFTHPVAIVGEGRFGAGWKFQGASARISVQGISILGYKGKRVALTQGNARIEYDGRRLFAPEAFAAVGTSFARGSFEMDAPSLRYRFLLEGHLQPADIGPWFGDWWRDLFSNFSFPKQPPYGNVDVQGTFLTARETSCFILADASDPTVRGAPFDRALVRIFTRANFLDAVEMFVEQGPTSARGTFVRRFDFDHNLLRSLDFEGISGLDLKPAPRMLGPAEAGAFGILDFAQPPSLKVSGHFDGPAAPSGSHRELQLDLRSDGPLTFYGYPLDRAAFHASVLDDRITVDRIDAGFSGGTAEGHAVLDGPASKKSLSFDCAVKDANLGRAIASFQKYSHAHAAGAAPGVGNYLNEKAQIHLDLNLHATGIAGDLASFKGSGSAAMQGSELKEIRLLGVLSRLLTFTALRFTNADTDFQLAGGQIQFSRFDLKGANSTIRASGTYQIAAHKLDFNAKLYPFENSASIPQKLLNIPFAPFSTLLEMKLTGDIDDPKWTLGIGFSDFQRGAPAASAAPVGGKPASK